MLPLLLALVPQVPGGFNAGDVVYTAAALNGGAGGIVVVDPLDGTHSMIPYGMSDLPNVRDNVAYDPKRDRLIFGAVFGSGNEKGLYAGTRSGGYTKLVGYDGPNAVAGIAAADDGRIYHTVQNMSGVRVILPDGAAAVVLDSFGQTWMGASLNGNSRVEYDPASNALIWASQVSNGTCNSDGNRAFFGKAVLDATGTTVVSEECTSFFTVPNPTAGDANGLALIEPGKLLAWVTMGNQAGQEKRALVLIEPEGGPGGTLQATEWADLSATLPNSYAGMTFSQARDEAVLLSWFFKDLVAAGEGDTLVDSVAPPGSLDVPSNILSMADIRSFGKKGLFPSDGNGNGVSKVSVGTGGQQDLTIDFGPAAFGDFYFVAGSFSGFTPFPFAGVDIPIVFDGYTTYTLVAPNSGPLVATLGVLDVDGRAQAALSLPPASPASLIGVVAHHTAVRIDSATATVTAATNATSLTFVP